MLESTKIYSIDELESILKVTKRTLYTYIKTGKLKACKMGKYWRVTQRHLDNFLSTGTDH